MNRLVVIMGIFIGTVPSTTSAASAFFKKKSSQQPQLTTAKGSVVRRLMIAAASTIKAKKSEKGSSRTVTSISQPGFLPAIHKEPKSPKTPDALMQVRRQPSGKSPLRLELPHVVHSSPVVSPTPSSASFHDLISPLALTSSSSGRSALSALSSPSSVSSASVVGSLSPSPRVETALAKAVDIPGLLQDSPAIEPLAKKRSSDAFTLPVAAQQVLDGGPQFRVLSQSEEVRAGSIEEEPPRKSLPPAGGCMRDELDDSSPISQEIDKALLQVTVAEVLHSLPCVRLPTPVMVREDVLTLLMQAAAEGNVEAIEKLEASSKKEFDEMPYGEKIEAFTQIQQALCNVAELLEKNPVWEHEEDEDAQYEREVLKPLESQGRPKWFKHYYALQQLAKSRAIEAQLGPDWEVADIQEELRKNPDNTVLKQWLDAHLKARQGLDTECPDLSPEYDPEYERLKRQLDAYTMAKNIMAGQLIEGLIIPAHVPVHVREAEVASFQ